MPGSALPIPRRRFLTGAVGLLASSLACGDDADPAPTPRAAAAGVPRSFFMGLSSTPSDPSSLAYEDAFGLAGRSGEVVLIQRAPPWTDFLPGRTISTRTERLTRLEKDLAEKNDLRLFLAIDITDPADRGRLASPPEALVGAGFTNTDVRAALIAYAKYLAFNYKPAYLAFGVEVDLLYSRRGDAAFRNFQSLYFEAYDAAKKESKETLIFPTFQYENLQGSLDPTGFTTPSLGLINRFEPKIDMIAISSFPGLLYLDPGLLPEDYYAILMDGSPKPFAFASVGWSSTDLPEVSPGGGRRQQDTFLRHVLAASDAYSPRLLVWYLGRDSMVETQPDLAALGEIGLLGADGVEKAAYRTWTTAASRPVSE